MSDEHSPVVFIRTEGREDGDVFWVERRRGTSSNAAVAFDLDELRKLGAEVARVLRGRS